MNTRTRRILIVFGVIILIICVLLGIYGLKPNYKNTSINNTTNSTTIDTTINTDEETTTTIPVEEETTTIVADEENNNNGTTTTTTKTPTNKPSNNNTVNIVSDREIIPDKYNTGVSGNLTKYTHGDNVAGLRILLSGTQDEPLPTINFLHKENQNSKYVIQNIDFTKYERIQIINYNVNNKIKLIFKNCKFDRITTSADMNDNISFEFDHCTISSFNGSNSTFNYCRFGSGNFDAITPYKNIYVNHSYIADIAAYTTGGEKHFDGVQISGTNGDYNFLVHDIHFYNTRFETPHVLEVRNGIPSTSYVNAPIMVQLEFNNATDISFENVIANGGGYTVYSTANKKSYMTNDVTYDRVSYKNVKIGYGHLYHELYPMKEELKAKTTFTNFGHYDSLYVTSVWKDNKGVHVITSNDTIIPRKLTCETNNGSFNFNIPSHPKLTKDNRVNYSFKDMPYDIDKVINDKNASYIKCYDTTTGKNLIRTQKL